MTSTRSPSWTSIPYSPALTASWSSTRGCGWLCRSRSPSEVGSAPAAVSHLGGDEGPGSGHCWSAGLPARLDRTGRLSSRRARAARQSTWSGEETVMRLLADGARASWTDGTSVVELEPTLDEEAEAYLEGRLLERQRAARCAAARSTVAAAERGRARSTADCSGLSPRLGLPRGGRPDGGLPRGSGPRAARPHRWRRRPARRPPAHRSGAARERPDPRQGSDAGQLHEIVLAELWLTGP